MQRRRNYFKYFLPPCHMYISLLVIFKMSLAKCTRPRDFFFFFLPSLPGLKHLVLTRTSKLIFMCFLIFLSSTELFKHKCPEAAHTGLKTLEAQNTIITEFFLPELLETNHRPLLFALSREKPHS